MKTNIFVLLFFWAVSTAFCQVISNPEEYVKKHTTETGRTYQKWVIDINHDGIPDILISQTPSSKEIEEENKMSKGDILQPNARAFGVFIGLKNGGYVNSKYVETSDGGQMGGVGIDMSQCYAGYVDEIKGWGIVTVEYKNRRKADVIERKVVCYTVDGDHIKETILDKSADASKPSAAYDKYLAESKRTKVQLQEVKP